MESEEIRKELKDAAFDQSQVEEASHFLVLAAQTTISHEHIDEYMEKTWQQRGM